MTVATPKKAAPERETLINLKGSTAQKKWVQSLARKTRIPLAQIAREGLTMWAKANGYDPMPEVDLEPGE